MRELIEKLKINWHYLAFLFLPILLLFIYVDSHFLDIGFLSLHSIDEYAFHGSLLNIYHGLRELRPSLLFRTGFYSYGFLYFFINFFFSLPFLILGKTSLVILIPKIISSISAVVLLFFVFKFFSLFTEKKLAVLPVLFIALIPAFWNYGSWFHPDMMMACFLVVTVYFLALDKGEYKKNYWLAGLFYALSLSIKFQAVTYFVIFVVYNLVFDFIPKKERLMKLIKILAISVGIFFLTNPYLFSSIGLSVFKRSLLDNVESNATNHGQGGHVLLVDKFNSIISAEYYNYFSIVLLLIVVSYFAKFLWKKENRISYVIFFSFFVNLTYLLFFVNKLWGWYYLPVMIFCLLVLVPIIKKFNQVKVLSTLTIFILIQFILNINPISEFFKFSYGNDVYEQNKSMSDFIVTNLKDKTKIGDNILISPNFGFAYDELGLKYDNIIIIWGHFSESSIDGKLYQKSVNNRYASSNAGDFKPFVQKDYIVLRKSDFPKESDQSLAAKSTEYRNSYQLVRDLYANKYNYKLEAENNDVVIFKNTSTK